MTMVWQVPVAGRSTRHSTAGHPDRRGGGHVDGNVMENCEHSQHEIQHRPRDLRSSRRRSGGMTR